MAELPTEEDFRKQLGTKFGVTVEAPRPLELELVEVKGWTTRPEEVQGMERFALTFRGPGDLFIDQNTYTLTHEEMGELLVFLVPVGRDERGFSYQAVFNFYR